ncbi:hypothetical protein ACQ1ZK_19695, partial [Enterococcus faecium]
VRGALGVQQLGRGQDTVDHVLRRRLERPQRPAGRGAQAVDRALERPTGGLDRGGHRGGLDPEVLAELDAAVKEANKAVSQAEAIKT